MGKTCVFCGESGKKSTNEHVFPNWTNELLKREMQLKNITVAHIDANGIRRQWREPDIRQRVNVVCEECNGGWMSDLERAVIPLLTPMIIGGPQHANIGPERQQTIARWAIKTAMMMEQVFPKERVLPPSDYTHIFKGDMPPGALVMMSAQTPINDEPLGALVATSKHASLISLITDAEGNYMPEDVDFRAGVVMFGIGFLVFWVFSHDIPTQIDVSVHQSWDGYPWDSVFRQLWPPYIRRVQWPPVDLNLIGGVGRVFDFWRNAN